jgi:type II secretory pathway pseudopilin PulG
VAILAALLFPAITAVKAHVRMRVTRTQITNLELAMETYFSEWGAYPPDRNVPRNLDSGQCLVYYLGTAFRVADGFSRNCGPYYEFPPDRVRNGRFVDMYGESDRTVYYYQFDNNLADGAGPGPYNSNVTNFHPLRFDMWSAGPDGEDDFGADDDIGNW